MKRWACGCHTVVKDSEEWVEYCPTHLPMHEAVKDAKTPEEQKRQYAKLIKSLGPPGVLEMRKKTVAELLATGEYDYLGGGLIKKKKRRVSRR